MQIIKDVRTPASLYYAASQRRGWSWFSNVLAANYLYTYAHQTALPKFVLPK